MAMMMMMMMIMMILMTTTMMMTMGMIIYASHVSHRAIHRV